MPGSPRAARPSTEALRAPDRRRLYEQLAAKLLDYVEVTGLRVGDRLPSERDLAEALRVSRASVRQAMRRHVNMVADIGLLRWSAAQQNGEDAG